MIRCLAALLTVVLLAGCAVENGGSSVTPPDSTFPAIDMTGSYSVETQELYAENEGQQIYGLLYRPVEAEGPRPVVIYAHGFGSSYRSGDQYARALAAQGYLVYCFDFRGGSESSRSEGSNLEMSIFTEQSDLEAVIAMMKARPDVDSRSIFLLGASQGGVVSAITAADNMDDYDVIFIGCPIWWDEAPAMIAAFLAEHEFSGKIIAPFCTSSYSPIDNSLHIFRELAPGAAITEGLTANSQSSIRPWVEQVLSQAAQ